MTSTDLKIFSYLPNPRVWKALIAGEYCGAQIEVSGDKPRNLGNWLWDAKPRLLADDERTDASPYARTGRRGFKGTLYKTDEFLLAHPFGTVPAAFSPDGAIGIFESNSILRASVRSAEDDQGLYGKDTYEASRIDSFLDASLVFAREAQVYLLGIENLSTEAYARMAGAYEFYLDGMERALGTSAYLAGDALTLADIAYVCDFGQFLRERFFAEALQKQSLTPIAARLAEEFPRAFAHLLDLGARPQFAKHLGNYLQGLAA